MSIDCSHLTLHSELRSDLRDLRARGTTTSLQAGRAELTLACHILQDVQQQAIRPYPISEAQPAKASAAAQAMSRNTKLTACEITTAAFACAVKRMLIWSDIGKLRALRLAELRHQPLSDTHAHS